MLSSSSWIYWCHWFIWANTNRNNCWASTNHFNNRHEPRASARRKYWNNIQGPRAESECNYWDNFHESRASAIIEITSMSRFVRNMPGWSRDKKCKLSLFKLWNGERLETLGNCSSLQILEFQSSNFLIFVPLNFNHLTYPAYFKWIDYRFLKSWDQEIGADCR